MSFSRLSIVFTVFLSVFVSVNLLADGKWKLASGGSLHTVAIKTDGSLWSWGSGIGERPVRIGREQDWASVSAGYSLFSAGIKNDGTLWTWEFEEPPTRVGMASNWKSVSVGGWYYMALRADGSLWALGSNNYGQLGDGTTTSRETLVCIGTDNEWAVVSTSCYHTVAIKTDGSLWAWGNNKFGQLGDGTTTNRTRPVRIGSDTNWVAVSAGSDLIEDGNAIAAHTLAVKSDGTLWAWGSNDYGQLGDGTTTNRTSPVQIGYDNRWIYISAGFRTSAALQSDTSLWTWGSNDYGQLGDGTTSGRITPTKIATKVRSVSVGYCAAVATSPDNTLWQWGYIENGRGEGKYQLTPREVK